jgi:TonB family protein
MIRSYGEREADYRKRLLMIVPIAVFLVFLVFMSSDVVPYLEIEKHLGWEGEIQLLPNITIVPDNDPYEDERESSRLRTMASMDLALVNDESPNPGEFPDETPSQKPDEFTTPEIDLDDIHHLKVHTDVPYSDDWVILHMVQPEYPPEELANGIEGEVTLEILVNEEGLVDNVWVLASYGPKSFEEASLAAVKQFRFKPPNQGGKPVPMWIRFQVRFRLTG